MLTLEKFLERVDALEEARILLAALEFKIFTVLDRKKMTSRQIAMKSKCHPEAMECLLNALVALGALRLRAGKYSSAPDMHKHFCESRSGCELFGHSCNRRADLGDWWTGV